MPHRSVPLRARSVRPCVLAVALLAVAGNASAQRVRGVPEALFRDVMPEAQRFAAVGGDPPVIRAYRAASDGTEALYGYVFLTSDLPPEQFGYSGPIEALVGMRPDGTLTGIHVTDYRESYMSSMGDFLSTPGFQEQFAGKHIGDPFQLWGDIEGISRVSISVRALSRGVRDSARRVAAAYGEAPEFEVDEVLVDPVGLSWFELRQRGYVRRFEVTEPGEGSAGIALAFIENERLGAYYFGSQLYERAKASSARRGGADNLMLYAIDGSRLRLFRQQGWSIEQDGDTTVLDPRNVISLGLPSGGIVAGEATMVGIMLVDAAIDVSRPFTFIYDLGPLGVHDLEYRSQEARRLIAEAEAASSTAQVAEAVVRSAETAAEPVAPDGAGSGAVRPDEVGDERVETERGAAEGPIPAAEEASTEGLVATTTSLPAGASGAEAPSSVGVDASESLALPDFVLTQDETLLERTLAGTSWTRVALMGLALLLASAAFFTKIVAVRWVALTVTLLVLGFGDGGFLSVSHITSGIWAGVGVYARDLPLLLIVTFTLVTTLVWGRVFCGFLCPFGALQDFIDRFVPRTWKRPLPRPVHDRARWVKYGILAVIVVPALAGSHRSVYQYFEPFGTVFFRSPSLLLWAIALTFLGASVVVPRFYCRYACPLGAALGLLSFVSLGRIRRVEQCTVCTVCEHKCPTGAIRRAEIDFPECVRCNVCELQLRDRTGTCRHDMESIRPRLVQLTVAARAGGDA
jgi:Na+-translocating ferredoxin:NAD+ oxidoreductase RnfG subunit